MLIRDLGDRMKVFYRDDFTAADKINDFAKDCFLEANSLMSTDHETIRNTH